MTDHPVPRPAIVSVMRACGWVAVTLSALTVALTLYCAAVLPGAAEGFAGGFVQSAGFDPATFSAGDAGEMSSVALITLVAAALALRGLHIRRPMLTRIGAGVWALFAVASAAVVGAVLALIVLGGSFVPAATRWFADEPLQERGPEA